MPESYPRRELLRRGLQTAAGGAALVATAGLAGGCGSTVRAVAPRGAPRRGGQATMATEAEITGFHPWRNEWDSTGQLYARTVYDPLAALTPAGEVRPYLARSITSDPSATVWTIALRPGVRFHDGSPCDAPAVKINLEGSMASPLLGPALADVAGVDVADPLTVVVTCATPWAAFARYLVGQIGYMAAPSYLTDPSRTATPLGTGPFVYGNWAPGAHFSASRNAQYWRPGMPYLDTMTYRPTPDTVARKDGLLSGSVQLLHSSNTQNIVDLLKARWANQVNDIQTALGAPGQHLVMLNTAVAPTDDRRVRLALALATDRRRVADVIYNGLTPPTDGPFAPTSPYAGATGYPAYDPSAARSQVAAYVAERGPLSLTLGTVNNQATLDAVELIQSMWEAVGIRTELAQFEQATFITNAVYGRFQAYLWRDFDAVDPDTLRNSWVGTASAPVGKPALNPARNVDPALDAALLEGRVETDPGRRADAYRRVAGLLGADLPYLWLTRVAWIVAAGSSVGGLATPTLPDGGPAVPMRSGVIWPSQLWRSQ